jgi:hypothetical protein
MHLDRVYRLPPPEDLPPPIEWVNPRRGETPPIAAVKEEEEFVADQIVGHGADDDGNMLVKVRWFGCPSSVDTWEPVGNLPRHILKRYAK